MAIRTDYVAGEQRTASQVNEENTKILENETRLDSVKGLALLDAKTSESLKTRSSAGTTDTDIATSMYNYTIPANSIQVGDVFFITLHAYNRIEQTGAFSGQVTSYARVKFGSSIVALIGYDASGTTTFDVSSYRGLVIHGIVTAIGASGKISLFSNSLRNDSRDQTYFTGFEITIDTTSTIDIDVNEYLHVNGSSRTAQVQVYGASVIKIPAA